MLLSGQHTAAELLKDAIDKKYTINGEMFSAEYLYQLSQNYFRDKGACVLQNGVLNCANVREQLIAGKCLLVPYPFQNTISAQKKISKYNCKFEFDKCVSDIDG